MLRSCFLLLSVAACVALGAEPVPFARDIRPVLAKRCLACHGADEKSRQAGLRLDVPGDAKAKAALIAARIEDPRRPMPPAGERLAPSEIAVVKRWLGEGARYDSHWAFAKPHRPAPPPVSNPAWVRNPIDNFVLARLDAEKLKPAPEASRHTLIRRLSLDLTGLPPTPAEADAFAADQRPDAYERLADRLLASAHYGERWARMWLDLARYADSQGYEKDRLRTIWPYRDWVIRAFNRNIPFDRFTVTQLAGDLLPGATEDDIIATGFHRNTMTNTEGGTDDEEFRDAAVKDRVATTGQVWMGLTTGCAQCHTHKYDPISHTEFYRLYAFFNQTEDADRADDAPVLKLANASTLVMKELAGEQRRVTRIHDRGSFLNPGAPVEPGVLAAFHPFGDRPANRLGLAQWIMSKDNPLTARVAANRFWARLFGAGIVETEEDFGTQGALPSHPELLDWLAMEFMGTDWNVKALLKTMVMSATYRQTSDAPATLVERDRNNRLLARGPRFRLDSEMIRDQALAASGLLNPKLHGAPVMPWQPEGIWQVVYSSDRWVTAQGEDRYRRGLYTLNRRTVPYPTSLMFDSPTGEVCTVRRIRTSTPLQALAGMNDPVLVEAAQRLALRTLAESPGPAREKAAHMFRLALTRPPREAEISRLLRLHAEAREELARDPAEARKLLNYDQILYGEARTANLIPDSRGEASGNWAYTTTEPAASWNSPEFDDGAWKRGRGTFGNKGGDVTAGIEFSTPWDTEHIWLRHAFEVSEGLSGYRLQLRYMGAYEAYINGKPASSATLDALIHAGTPLSEEALASLRPGRNVLAIHVNRFREGHRGQHVDAGLTALRPARFAEGVDDAGRAAWVMVASTVLNLDETLTRR